MQTEQWEHEKEEQFQCSTIEDYVVEGESGTVKETADQGEEYMNEELVSPKRRKFVREPSSEDHSLPANMRHVRTSERVVREDIYECLADLQGYGLSVAESMKSLVRVAKLFGRKWKMLDDDKDTYDLDTLPHEKNLRTAVTQIEAKGMSSMIDELQKAKSEGRMVTHATDSTTKKGIGQFGVSGLDIGQNVPFPLPLFEVCGEKTEDIAEQCNLIFEILGVVKSMSVDELYNELVDTHITDSTDHNKGFAKILQEMYNLDDPKGQLFCGVHTTLGFSSAMNKMLAIIERDMTLEAILNNFMIDLDFDSKHGSVAGQACDVILRLDAPEFSHKPWNYYDAFLNRLKGGNAEAVLFAYKDHRFGCLSRACAVILYIRSYLKTWLDENPGITNRLACLVRDFLNIQYLELAFAVFSSIGIQLIEPFLAYTTADGATHSSLKEFFESLHKQMADTITKDFFNLKSPWFKAVSQNMHDAIKQSYNLKVVEAVEDKACKNIEECLILVNFIMPELRTVLGRQRKDYGISDEFAADYPVKEQASDSDDTPVHNIGMERMCGLVGYRAQKLKSLEAVSRSIILDGTDKLRENADVSFRAFRHKAKAVRDLKLKWSSKMKKKFKQKLSEKQAVAIVSEEKRLELLEKLKQLEGPFTKHEEVEQFYNSVQEKATQEKDTKKASEIWKQAKKRLKMELKFAKESSTTLPKWHPLFRMQVTLPNKKRHDKNAEEFSIALNTLLGRKSAKTAISIEKFKKSLFKVSQSL